VFSNKILITGQSLKNYFQIITEADIEFK